MRQVSGTLLRYMLPAVVLLTLFLGFGALVPTTFAIDENALVTCDGVGINGLVACDICTFIAMIVKVTDFLVMILVIMSVIMLAITGIQMAYVAAGGSDAHQILKERMTNIVIGFLLIIAAWTIIDTVLKALVVEEAGIVEIWKTDNNDLCKSHPTIPSKTPTSFDGSSDLRSIEATQNQRGSGLQP